MGFQTTLLNSNHKKSLFDCEQPALTKYIKEQAGQDIKRKLALCFVKVDLENNVEGYYTLSNASIPRISVPEEIQKKLCYKDIPVTLLGRLARDKKFKNHGLGELLLMDALRRSV